MLLCQPQPHDCVIRTYFVPVLYDIPSTSRDNPELDNLVLSLEIIKRGTQRGIKAPDSKLTFPKISPKGTLETLDRTQLKPTLSAYQGMHHLLFHCCQLLSQSVHLILNILKFTARFSSSFVATTHSRRPSQLLPVSSYPFLYLFTLFSDPSRLHSLPADTCTE